MTIAEPSAPSISLTDTALEEHIFALGLMSVSSYKLWCRRHGFAMETDKSDDEREAEIAFLRRLGEPDDPEADRLHDPRDAEYIRRIASGDLDGEKLTDVMTRVRRLFAEVDDAEGGREALLRMLLHVEYYGNLLVCTLGCKQAAHSQRNLVISGLSQLARCHRHWIRPPEAWRPSSRKPQSQFADLAAHLFARYPIPPCLNAGWFDDDAEEAAIQQGWYLHIGAGQNIRTAEDLPFRPTRRAAHLFMTSYDRVSHSPPLAVLRHAQICAFDMDANRKVLWDLAHNEYLRGRQHGDFWTTVIQFLLNNPMLERSYIGPVIDYIHHVKYEPRRLPQPDGSVRVAPPKHPNFSVKSRSMAKLVREVDEWHRELSEEEYECGETWEPAGFNDFALTEYNAPLQRRVQWSIHELRSTSLLQFEGRVMGHCVGSYAKRCMSGESSIWSLRSRVEAEDAEQRHVMTIAVDNQKRIVTQARGRYNLLPFGRTSRRQSRQTDGAYRIALRESARILASWRQREGLAYAQE